MNVVHISKMLFILWPKVGSRKAFSGQIHCQHVPGQTFPLIQECASATNLQKNLRQDIWLTVFKEHIHNGVLI
jgi:hypothetical protein